MKATATSTVVLGAFDESIVEKTVIDLRQQLGGSPTLGLVFTSADYVDHAEDFLDILRVHGRLPALAGCTGHGFIRNGSEIESQSGFSLLLLSIPETEARTYAFDAVALHEGTTPAWWHQETRVPPDKVSAWLTFLDPFQIPIEAWLRLWNEAYPGIPTFGGLSSSSTHPHQSWAYCDDRVIEGGVSVALCGKVKIHAVVSQGCRPIGEPLTITKADQNILYSLGSRPALEVLNGAFDGLSDAEKLHARGHIFAGLAMNEYVDDFKRGHFLVRTILGADPQTGAVALGGYPRIGQTLQYQLRDASAAAEDIAELLRLKQEEILNTPPFAALLCTCAGRGRHLFGKPNHDAGHLQETFPGLPVSGFFGNGEIGPVGNQNFAHGYTASIALFCPAPS